MAISWLPSKGCGMHYAAEAPLPKTPSSAVEPSAIGRTGE